ncbi:MarR family transcriptional regulator [Microtetraspora sp. NBRC 16547]|uniref:MarR family winged helix-turn-helix transcriptional regulator n=1 Tax=Microtetraspora sp. NBRC 16547 TaxID=3030993 RepID=UPI0024A57AEE|nr:MarR family transcriptional regulator [Microtetraspora sp. NBRC 16547]GLX01559.1 MarR family transcriptional regulator [Microtetraspora sp. NBRC 16547]
MNEVRWLDAEEQQAWRAYLDGTRLLIQALDRQLEADAGVSMLDYEVLVMLSEAPDQRMRMRDLADAVLSTRSGATRAVTRLERLGWVRRTDCEDDRRGTEAELTEDGVAKLAATAPGHVAAVRAHMFDLLTPREVALLRTVGTKIRGHLQRPAS